MAAFKKLMILAVVCMAAVSSRCSADIAPELKATTNKTNATQYKCDVCGHVYVPSDGGGLPFEKLPDTWKCPICGSPKSAYKPMMMNGEKVWVHED